ncbi:hypothetical protein DESC_870058 [Desulfosarcina cetonica]|nr:hypothetical protein DESC_870058 [Desulfosarcina cetonica]
MPVLIGQVPLVFLGVILHGRHQLAGVLSRPAGTDGAVIHLNHRHQALAGPGDEHLVGGLQLAAGDVAHLDGKQAFGQFEDHLAGHAGENPPAGRHQPAAHKGENVGCGALQGQTVAIDIKGFDGPGRGGFLEGQAGRDVVDALGAGNGTFDFPGGDFDAVRVPAVGQFGNRRNQYHEAGLARRGHEVGTGAAGDHDADIGFGNIVFRQGGLDHRGDLVMGPGQG